MDVAIQPAQHGTMGGPDFPGVACLPWVTHPRDAAELRTLIELPALRKLAERGFTDEEFAVSGRLARATVRSACNGDLPGFLEADAVFHLYLLGLTSDPIAGEVARLLLDARVAHGPAGRELAQRMGVGGGEHGEIVALLADGMVSAASEMLRRHVAGDVPAPAEP